jgi:hypothetical protein
MSCIWERPDWPLHQRLRVETFFFTLAKKARRKEPTTHENQKSAGLFLLNPRKTKKIR